MKSTVPNGKIKLTVLEIVNSQNSQCIPMGSCREKCLYQPASRYTQIHVHTYVSKGLLAMLTKGMYGNINQQYLCRILMLSRIGISGIKRIKKVKLTNQISLKNNVEMTGFLIDAADPTGKTHF